MPTILPIDLNSNAIPAVRLRNDGAHQITASTESQRNESGFSPDTRVVSVYATKAVYLRFGDSSAVATDGDHYFPGGVYYDIAIGGGDLAHYTHLAVLRVSEDGVVYVSEKE